MADRILVVDDEPSIRRVLHDILLTGSPGCEVDEAANGIEALAKIHGGPPDSPACATADADRGACPYHLVFTDLSMPRMDGFELLDMLHAERPDLPVVVVTAYGGEDNILHCFSRGAWDYILKPFNIEHVRAAARRALVAGNQVRKRPGDLEVVSSGPGWLELTAASELEYILRFRKFTEMLLSARVPADVREDLRFAIEEVGRNAMEWGNRYDPDKRLRLAYRLADDRIVVRIGDEGEGFDPDGLPNPAADPAAHVERRLREGKRVGGYGIHIVRKLMDEVTFSGKGNTVTMTKYLAGRRGG